MRYEESYTGWQEGRLTQADAGRLLGLIDRRMAQVSSRRTPVDEVLGVHSRCTAGGFAGWNVKHFHACYRREHGGSRSYSWVKNVLQEAGWWCAPRCRASIAKSASASPCRR